jgi:carbon-monoxide dehydrogenase iron sulfur subunit
MKKIMMINDKCDNCGDCVKACMELYGVSRISILEYEDNYLPIVCQHCSSAPCMQVCPVNAIEFRGDVVYLDDEKCIGCGLCALACPFGAIVMADKAHKCVLCIEKDEPACVKACSKRCLEAISVEDAIWDKKLKNIENFAKLTLNKKIENKEGLISKITVNARVKF